MDYIAFEDVVRNHKKFPKNLDYDTMNENFITLKPMLRKMFFEEYPAHPEYFILLLSQRGFADDLINSMLKAGITNLNRVWFRECSTEEKEILLDKGFIPKFFSLLPHDIILSIIASNDDCFVNLIP